MFTWGASVTNRQEIYEGNFVFFSFSKKKKTARKCEKFFHFLLGSKKADFERKTLLLSSKRQKKNSVTFARVLQKQKNKRLLFSKLHFFNIVRLFRKCLKLVKFRKPQFSFSWMYSETYCSTYCNIFGMQSFMVSLLKNSWWKICNLYLRIFPFLQFKPSILFRHVGTKKKKCFIDWLRKRFLPHEVCVFLK